LKRNIITTADGSTTIRIEDWNESYHSKHGAIQEARHVFIKMGLLHVLSSLKPKELSILEIGFGTGLNALLTALQVKQTDISVKYMGVEAYPVRNTELKQLNFSTQLGRSNHLCFEEIHNCEWEKPIPITANFTLIKRQQFFQEINDNNCYDLIYFDAFSSRVQPELWTQDMFGITHKALKPGGVLVTYAAIGQVRRDMKNLGFEVERLKGPPGKRHMLRATKSNY
jgi:tRNA U34 5-methylaminomethyl-2-thiouridine-forming methyltransferase MnmC